MKQTIRISESQLKQIIKESVKRVLRENNGEYNTPIDILYGSPGYPWKATIINIQNNGNYSVLEIVDKDGKGERDVKLQSRLFDKLMKTGQVQYTSGNGGYVEIIIPELYSGEDDEEEDYDFSDLPNPKGSGNPSHDFYGGSYPYGFQESKFKENQLKQIIKESVKRVLR